MTTPTPEPGPAPQRRRRRTVLMTAGLSASAAVLALQVSAQQESRGGAEGIARDGVASAPLVPADPEPDTREG